MFRLVVFALIVSSPAFTQQKESWVNKPLSQWPEIALRNQVHFKNGDQYVDPSFKYAATGFLINYKNQLFAATAKHVLWIAKNKKTKTVQINSELKSWSMKPKGNNRDSAIIGKLINEDSLEILEGRESTIVDRDWLVFSVIKSSPKLQALRPRFSPLQENEKVFIVSAAYDDSLSTVQEGKVFKKFGMDILIERDMSTHKGGSSGSPVLDANGFLVGILSSASAYNKTGVSVAISTEYLRAVLDKSPDLNTPKKDYGVLLLQTVLSRGAESAIKQYDSLVSDPKNYYLYNLRSPNRNGLRETGEKLLAMNRAEDAVIILRHNANLNGEYFVNLNIFAKALFATGNKEGAIHAYTSSIMKNKDAGNEAYKELEKLNAPFKP